MQLLRRQNTGNQPDANQLARRLAQALQQWGEDLLQLDPAQFRGISPLLSAMQQGQSLKELLQGTAAKSNELSTAGYPATSPLLALRAAVNSVWERNILPGWVESYAIDRVFSPNGRWLVSLSGMRGGRGFQLTAIHLYDLLNQQQYDLPTAGNSIEFTPDGQRLLIGAGETTRLLDLATRKFTDLKLKQGYPRISPDGQYLIQSIYEGEQSSVYVYDLTGKQIAQIPGFLSEFRPQRRQFIVIDRQTDRSIAVLYDFTGKRIGSVPGEFARFSPDGNWVAIAVNAAGDASTVLYNLVTQQRIELLGSLFAFNAGSDRLLTTVYRNDTSSTYLYDMQGQVIVQLPGGSPEFSVSGRRVAVTIYAAGQEESGIYNAVNGQAIGLGLRGGFRGFSPDEQTLLTTEYDNQTQTQTTRLYAAESAEVLATLPGGAFSQNNNFSANGQRILTTLERGMMALSDRDGNLVSRLPGVSGNFSRDSEWLVTQSFDDQVHLYDLKTQQPGTLAGYQATFSPNGQVVATTQYRNSRNATYLYDVVGNLLAVLSGLNASFSRDSQLLVTSDGAMSYLYNLQGQRLAEMAGADAQFTPDGQLILTLNREGQPIGSWFDRQGRSLGQFSGVNPIFSADRKRMATTQYGEQEQSIVYDLATRQEVVRVDGIDPIFSADGRFLATVTYGGVTVDQPFSRLYDLGEKRLVAQLNGVNPRFSADSQAIAVSFFPQDSSARPESVTVLYSMAGQEMARLTGTNPRFSPTAKQVMVTSFQTAIATSRLYDFTGKQLAQFVGAESYFSPDGQRVLLTLRGEGNFGASRLYDLTGKLLADIAGGFVGTRLDGQSFVVSERDRTRFYAWTGALLAEFPGSAQTLEEYGRQNFQSQVISADGRLLLTTWNEQVRIWSIDGGLDDLLNRGCQWLQAYLATHPEMRDRLEICGRG